MTDLAGTIDQAIRPTPPVKISLTLREQEAGAGCIMKGENPMPNLEESIRERAYHLWIADGQPDGQADIYWLNAQREILTTSVAPTDTGSVATKPGKKARVARSGKSKARAHSYMRASSRWTRDHDDAVSGRGSPA